MGDNSMFDNLVPGTQYQDPMSGQWITVPAGPLVNPQTLELDRQAKIAAYFAANPQAAGQNLINNDPSVNYWQDMVLSPDKATLESGTVNPLAAAAGWKVDDATGRLYQDYLEEQGVSSEGGDSTKFVTSKKWAPNIGQFTNSDEGTLDRVFNDIGSGALEVGRAIYPAALTAIGTYVGGPWGGAMGGLVGGLGKSQSPVGAAVGAAAGAVGGGALGDMGIGEIGTQAIGSGLISAGGTYAQGGDIEDAALAGLISGASSYGGGLLKSTGSFTAPTDSMAKTAAESGYFVSPEALTDAGIDVIQGTPSGVPIGSILEQSPNFGVNYAIEDMDYSNMNSSPTDMRGSDFVKFYGGERGLPFGVDYAIEDMDYSDMPGSDFAKFYGKEKELPFGVNYAIEDMDYSDMPGSDFARFYGKENGLPFGVNYAIEDMDYSNPNSYPPNQSDFGDVPPGDVYGPNPINPQVLPDIPINIPKLPPIGPLPPVTPPVTPPAVLDPTGVGGMGMSSGGGGFDGGGGGSGSGGLANSSIAALSKALMTHPLSGRIKGFGVKYYS